MTEHAFRIADGASRHLAASAIDRSRPVRFRLNGHTVTGLAGDTVLSAALASGFDTAGRRNGHALALDARFSPPVIERSSRGDATKALPMDRLPALNGLDLTSLGVRDPGPSRYSFFGRLRDRLSGRARSLNHLFDSSVALAGPWADRASASTIPADVVIVGGGLAGLSAALFAGRAGDRVVLVERAPMLGGSARFFGSVEGEDAPEVTIARMTAELATLSNVTILLRAEALAVFDTTVRVHQVETAGNGISTRIVDLRGRAVILAQGSIERLPLFPGNRLPRVTGALAAWQLADRFGLFAGRSAVVSTSTNEAYRLGMYASDAGLAVARIADSRLQPQSRFIEFSKAYGIPLFPGTVPIAARQAPGDGRGLTVTLGTSLQGATTPPVTLDTGLLIVSGGWQPELTLWHMAGGASHWQAARSRLEAVGEVPDIALAGAMAGYNSHRGCLQSGAAAVARLFLRFAPDIDDPRIDALYETPDAPPAIAPATADIEDTYLDGGFTFITRPAAASVAKRNWWPFRKVEDHQLARENRVLGVADVAAAVALDATPAADAGTVAQERCVMPRDLIDAREKAPTIPSLPIVETPAWLVGRYGPGAQVWLIEIPDNRAVEIGALIYPSADPAKPPAAIGAVIGPAPTGKRGTCAYFAATVMAGAQVFVRTAGQTHAARVVLRPADATTAR
ncbi:MAG: FAD-dependent oxidoreductase [Devosia sp.]|nr:FAD-dependent oxidoreductase [Devosia sp.]